MDSTHTPSTSKWRALLVLGRVSNVPTVWSNCLAGWILAEGGPWGRFALLCLGATLVYIGGMYLNDAYDADFDRQYRQERPIPAGVVTEQFVLHAGLAFLGIGAVILIFLGNTTAWMGLLLTLSVILYDAVHKRVDWAPILMSLCRFFLFLAAAATGRTGITGLALWSAIVLAAYIIGLSYLARRESLAGPLRYWPCYLLGAPLLLAWLANPDNYRQADTVLSLVLGIWVMRCLYRVFWTPEPQIGRAVSGLLAGIVLVDLLAVAGPTNAMAVVFLGLFGLALLFQRLVPAT